MVWELIMTKPLKIITAVKADTQDNTKHTNVYTTVKDKMALLQAVGERATLLYLLYLDSCHIEDCTFDDSYFANILGVSTQTVQKERLRLEKAGYFYKVQMKSNKGVKFIYFFIGLDSVRAIKNLEREYGADEGLLEAIRKAG
jgi:hypothetical protein